MTFPYYRIPGGGLCIALGPTATEQGERAVRAARAAARRSTPSSGVSSRQGSLHDWTEAGEGDLEIGRQHVPRERRIRSYCSNGGAHAPGLESRLTRRVNIETRQAVSAACGEPVVACGLGCPSATAQDGRVYAREAAGSPQTAEAQLSAFPSTTTVARLRRALRSLASARASEGRSWAQLLRACNRTLRGLRSQATVRRAGAAR